jgi:lipoprotein-releasing system permease protein
MTNALSVFLAWRYIRSRHGNGFANFISASSTIGIGLGVMVLIVVLSAMNGFEQVLENKLLAIVPHAEIISVDQPLANWQENLQRVKKEHNVVAAAPVIKLAGMMQKDRQLKALEIRGVDVVLETSVSNIQDYITQGNWQALTKQNSIIIGAGIAKKLAVKLGDKVQILLPKQVDKNTTTSHFSAPIKHNVTVVGIFKFGGVIDDTLAYMSLSQTADIIGLLPEQAHGIRLKVKDVFQAPEIARKVAYQFEQYVYIYDWTYTQGHLFNDIQLVRMVMFIVLALVIAVASFNIVSTLVMTVNEKQSDIAILLTMGAKRMTIMKAFILQGLFNGIVGSSVGALLGIYLSLNLTNIMMFLEKSFGIHFLSSDVYFIDYLPSQLQVNDVVVTLIIAMLLSILATLYPAWQATKIQPAQVLGHI